MREVTATRGDRRSRKAQLDLAAGVLLLVVLGGLAFLATRFGFAEVPNGGVAQALLPGVVVLILMIVEPVAVHRAVKGSPVLPVVLAGFAALGACMLLGVVRYDLSWFPGW